MAQHRRHDARALDDWGARRDLLPIDQQEHPPEGDLRSTFLGQAFHLHDLPRLDA
jgi:hypothetical protein